MLNILNKLFLLKSFNLKKVIFIYLSTHIDSFHREVI